MGTARRQFKEVFKRKVVGAAGEQGRPLSHCSGAGDCRLEAARLAQ